MMDCECKHWARGSIFPLTEHHPSCPKYNLKKDATEIIEDLLAGIVTCANDEDGVHDACWEAFKHAAYFIGKPELVKNRR